MKCHSSEESQFRHCSSGSLRRWMDRPSDGCGRTCCRGYHRSLASEHLLLIGRMLMSHFFRWSSDVIAVKNAVGKCDPVGFCWIFLWNLLAEGGKRSVIDKLSTHTDGAYHWRAARNGKCLFLTSTSWNNSFFMAIDIVKLPMVYLQNELKRRCCCMNVMDSLRPHEVYGGQLEDSGSARHLWTDVCITVFSECFQCRNEWRNPTKWRRFNEKKTFDTKQKGTMTAVI